MDSSRTQVRYKEERSIHNSQSIHEWDNHTSNCTSYTGEGGPLTSEICGRTEESNYQDPMDLIESWKKTV